MNIMKLGAVLTLALATLAPTNTAQATPHSTAVANKYAGQFVFSNRPVPYEAKSEEGFLTSLTLKDTVHVRFWGSDTPKNLVPNCRGDVYQILYSVSINGSKRKTLDLTSVKGAKATGLRPTLHGPLTTQTTLGDALTRKTMRFVREWNSFVVPRLKVGNNTVNLSAKVRCARTLDGNAVIASKDIAIKVGAGDQAEYVKKYGPHLAPSPLPEGDKLMPLIIAEKTYRDRDVVGGRFGSGWVIKHHKYNGRPMYRYATVVLVTRLRNETSLDVCETHDISVKQQSLDGDSKYSKTPVVYGSGGRVPIACSAVALNNTVAAAGKASAANALDLTAAFAKVGRKTTSKVTIDLPMKDVKVKPEMVTKGIRLTAGRSFKLRLSKKKLKLKAYRKRSVSKSGMGNLVGLEVDEPHGYIAKYLVRGKPYYHVVGNTLGSSVGKKGKKAKRPRGERFGCQAATNSLDNAKAALKACHSVRVTK